MTFAAGCHILPAMSDLLKALDSEISALESRLAALKSARSALTGGGSADRSPRGPGRRKFTAAQRAEISRRMKALWAKRRKE